jgi:hypothetical protein
MRIYYVKKMYSFSRRHKVAQPANFSISLLILLDLPKKKEKTFISMFSCPIWGFKPAPPKIPTIKNYYILSHK